MHSPITFQSTSQTQPASLRRLDWRFLLPHAPTGKFRHLRLWGGPTGLDDLIVAANLAEQVSFGGAGGPGQPPSEPDSVDAVAVLGDCRVSLEQAIAGLEPNGVLYQEIARRSLRSLRLTPKVIRRRLEHAGLTLTGLYWATPDFEHCRRYIPLDVPGAVRWYLSALFVAGTPVHRLIEALLGFAVGRHSRRLGWLVPCLSVTAVAGRVADAANLPAPSILNRPEVRRLLPQTGLRPLVLTSGQDDASRLVMLPFAPAAGNAGAQPVPAPEAVIKLATHPTFNVETELEQTVLQAVRTRLGPQMRRSIPQPLGSFRYGELAVGVERVAPGRSLWVSSGGWGTHTSEKVTDLVSGIRWLIEFHGQTEVRRIPWNQQAIARWIDAPLAAYAQVRAIGDGERQLFAALQAYAQTLVGTTLPLAWQHHDFAPWNIYRAGERFTVIDWEFNRDWHRTQAGPGLCDVLYFVTHWHNIAQHLYTEAAELQGLRTVFLRPTCKTHSICAARKAMAHYISARKIDRHFLPLLLVYTWVERVVYSHARAQKLETRAGADRAAGKFVRYIQTLADHAEQLFSAAYADRLLG